MERLRSPYGRVLGGLASGILLMFAFEPYNLWALAPFSVAVLTLAARHASLRVSAGVGLAAGLGLFVPLLHWAGIYVGPVPWLILAGFEALYVVPLALGLTLVQRLPGWPLWTAALFVAEEAVRGRWPFGGFTWGRIAFSQVDGPVLGLAKWGGAPLMTFAVALAGGLLAYVVVAAKRGPGRLAGASLAAAAAVIAFGALIPAATPTGPAVVAAVIQGNVPQLGLDFNAQREAVLRNHVAGTEQLAADVAAGRAEQPDLVIWPENASDVDPYRDAGAAELIQGAVDAIGVPVLVGAVITNPDDPQTVLNVGIVWGPTTQDGSGPGERYVKQHPVPFAEYIPFRSIARRISSQVDRVARDFAPGTEPGVLQVGPAKVGDVICFEVAYDGLVRTTVRAGADLLSVQTNNATFGRTPQTEQQLAMSRLRAVEHGRWVLVAATSGVSATIAPDGDVVQRAEIFTSAQLVQQVRLSDALTPADRLGAFPELIIAVIAFGAVVWSGTVGTRRRRSPDTTASPDDQADPPTDEAVQPRQETPRQETPRQETPRQETPRQETPRHPRKLCDRIPRARLHTHLRRGRQHRPYRRPGPGRRTDRAHPGG